ncbi:MAG: DUF115 domain-containing protein, partial [Treponema sp.]|nr:DUF115 domain-containing protein [Treponema sp.]
MEITFSLAKNGEKTCKISNAFLHSAYNPVQEALRFVDSLSYSFAPLSIIVTEPCLSYCAPFFRKKFPNAKIFAIRYSTFFSDSDSLWDKVFYISKINLDEELFNFFGEEVLLSTLFVSWKASDAIFKNESEYTWNVIRKTVQKSMDVLFTRSYFAKRWILNSAIFCSNVKKIFTIQKGTSPIVISASGKSLSGILPLLKKTRESFFLIAASSSLSVLDANNIKPDLCISTDGGYYAKAHLFPLFKNFCDVPLAISCESACPKKILQNHSIVPLSYTDGITNELLDYCKINSTVAKRNGSVSGTALELALSITSGDVYLCGLDLFPSSSFQHARPNLLEEKDNDFRTKTKESNIMQRRFSSSSLSVYSDWFSTFSNSTERIFRLSNDFQYKNKFRNIADVNEDFFSKKLMQNKNQSREQNKKPSFVKNKLEENIRERTKDFFEKKFSCESWISEIFPADYLFYKRSLTQEDKQKVMEDIIKKNEDF